MTDHARGGRMTHEERVYHHMYETLEGIAEQSERIASLEELVLAFYHCTTSGECDECPINGGGLVRLMPDTICYTIHDRMRELGVDA